MIQVYIQYPNIKEARRISKLLLKARLAACISFFDQQDLYWWKGKLVSSRGVVTLVAAPKKNYQRIEALVKDKHPYEVPCILELPVSKVHGPYKKWLYAESK